jgi:two-component system, chemotaxis family, chemotaxis protein CheY
MGNPVNHSLVNSVDGYLIHLDGCHAYRKTNFDRRRLYDDDGYHLSVLKDEKYTDIDCLHDGGSALAALRQKEYDLVITDWQMHPITGIELTKLIRADARLSKVRIILITGLHGKDDEAWLGGADGYVTKPFEPIDLIEKVEDVLSPAALLA